MGHGNLKWTKIGLGALTAAAVSLPLQACNTSKTGAEVEAGSLLIHSALNRGVKTHLEEERRIQEQDKKTAEAIIDIFGDPNKDRKKKKKKPVTQSGEGGGNAGGGAAD